MIGRHLNLLRVILDPRVSATPLRVLAELRRRGKRRLPAAVEAEVAKGRPRRRTFAFVRRWLHGELLTRHRGQWVLNSFLPPFPGAAYNRMFENLLTGRRLSPVSAYLAVTAACPCDCGHCSLKNRRDGHLDTATWKAAIAQLHGLGASIVGFTGGEPLLRDDLPELVRAAANGASTLLFTSGVGFDRAKAMALREVGLWGVCVSLDAADAALHDQGRGRERAYDEAIAALRLARDLGFYTMIGAVATPRFVVSRAYERLYNLASSLRVHELRIVEAMPCGRLRGAADEALLSPEQVAELRAFHVATNRRGKSPKVCAFNQIESPELFGCGGGTQHLFIDPAGEVCPCDFTPLSFGNVTHTPLAAIWARMTAAMGNPRRRCFIQCQRHLVEQVGQGTAHPLPPDLSERVCALAGQEPMPDYFQAIAGSETSKEGE